ncbi:MAG: hypothetical protein IH991_25375 [Planctomycetes bacterium]|nr:hypothetical protein [Planctomycetota bacterium]
MRKLVAFLLPLVLCASPAMAGSVFISGHDAEDHGSEAIYAGLYDNILSNVTNGGSGILSIGANGGTPAANWIMDVASLMTFPQAVTLVNGFAISSVDFSGFAILHIPSDRGDVIGGILPAENVLLTARAA